MKKNIQRHKEQEINRLRDFIRLQGLSISSEKSYIRQLAKFIDFISSRDWPVGTRSEAKVEAWLTSIARRDVASSTQNQAFHAT